VDGEPTEERPETTRGEGHVKVVRDFVEAVNSGDWSAHRGLDGVVRARVISACYESAAAGREVLLR
jgi:predicted dehydrogenase